MRWHAPTRDDRGASLVMAMLFVTGIGLVVVALLSYGLVGLTSAKATAQAAQSAANVGGALQTAINDVRNSTYNNDDNNPSVTCLGEDNRKIYAPLATATPTLAAGLDTTVICSSVTTSGSGSGSSIPIRAEQRPPAAVLTLGTYWSGAAEGAPSTAPSGITTTPGSGPAATSVVVSGTNFAGATALQVGTATQLATATGVTMSPCPDATPAAGCFVANGNQLTILMPAHAPGAVLVRVITLGAKADGTFTYMSVPTAPVRPSVTAGTSSATIAWTAPADGGSPITGYVITPRRDGVVQPTISVAATPTSATVNGLTAGASYTFTVSAVNAAGTSDPSPESTPAVPYALPAAPAQPTATAGLANATVSWTAPADGAAAITGYVITPYKAGVAQTPVPVGVSPTATISPLAVGFLYTFTVAAKNAAGTGPASPLSNGVTPYATPGTPAQPTAVAGVTSATVSWVAPADGSSPITGYVLRSYRNGVVDQTLYIGVTLTRTYPSLTAGASYTFAVAAQNAGGTGPFSPTSAAVVPYTTPGAPAQPTATAGLASVALTWSAPTDNGASAITGYVITPYRASVAQTPIPVGATPTSATISGLTPDISYTFTVAAVNAAGTGPPSVASVAVVPYALPGAPAQPTATAGPAQATVTWAAPASGTGITGYVVTPYRTGIAQTPVSVGATPTTTTISGLTVGASYTFTVAAVNAAGTGPASVQSVAVVPYAVPSAPVQPVATAGTTTAVVTWTAPFDGGRTITGYVITPYRANVAQTPIAVGPTPTSATVSGLSVGISYTFTVAAVNSIGTGPASVQSNAVLPYTVPSAPAQPTATAGTASAIVTWAAPYDGASAITGYVITPYRSGIAQSTILVGATPTSKTISGLVVGASYTFTVAAQNAAGTGPPSPASAAVTPYAVPDAPAQPTATAGVTSATVTWSAPFDGGLAITGYLVTPFKDGTAQTAITYGATPTTRTVSGLTAGSSYTFTVAATNSAGTGPQSAKSAAVVPYTVPGAPPQPVATAGAGSAVVDWTAPSNGFSPITGYIVTPYIGTTPQTAITVGPSLTEVTVNGLTVGTPYTFTVIAVNAAGNGPPSPASAAVTPYTVPTAPARPVATAGRSSATVTWTAPFNGYSAITSYVITPYRAGSAQTPVTVAASPLTRTFTGLDIGVSYTFTVAAVNAAGSSPASLLSNAVVPFAVVPGAPATPTAVAGYWSATITWSAPDNGDSAITGYVVTPYKDGVASTPVTVGATPTSMVFGGLTPGASHTFTVAAKNAIGTGPQSAQSNAVIPYTTPSAPARPTATARQAAALVSWVAPFNGYSAITEYVITPYRGTSAQPAVTVAAPATSTTIDNLVVGASYTFTVAARNAGGLGTASPQSNAVIPYAVVPDAPTIGTLIAGTEAVTLQWTAPADDGDSPINGYIVEGEQFFNGSWSSLGSQTFDSPATTQTYNGLPAGLVIRVRVKARNAIGTGPLSGYSNTVTINADPVLTFPSPLAAGRVAQSYSVTLTRTDGTAPFMWAVVSGALPPGLSLNTSSGVISGTPTTTGTYGFTIRLTDSSGVTATKSTSINIQPRFALREVGPASATMSFGTWPATWLDPAPSLVDGGYDARPDQLLAVLRDPWRRFIAGRRDRPRQRASRRRGGSRGRLLLRLVATGTALGLLTSALVLVTPTPDAVADGTELFNQPFHNSTADGVGAVALPDLADVAATNMACLTASGNPGPTVPASCPSGTDAPGSGKLRLTDSGLFQTGGLFAASSMPISLGLDVSFDMYQYGGTNADGIAMVVAAVDPAIPVSPENLGQTGGALGYSPSFNSGETAKRGLSHGYMGFGFDVYGNYSSTVYQGTGCVNPPYVKNGTVPGQVVIRGPGHGLVGYCAINSTASVTSPAPAVVPIKAATRALSRVPVEVVINPSAASLTSASGIVASPNTYTLVFSPVGQAARTLTGVLPTVPAGLYPKRWINAAGYPKQLAFGWVGSTGASTDFHEIDVTRVSTLSPAPAPMLVVGQTGYAPAAATFQVGDPVTYTVTTGVLPGSAEPAPITVTETLPDGIVPVSAFGTDWECDPPVGQKISCLNTAVPFASGSTLSPLTITAVVTASGITPLFMQTNSIVSASSRDAETVYGGETGWRNGGIAPLRVVGPVYSNSTIVTGNGFVPPCTDAWPLTVGRTDCNGIYVDGTVIAERSCTGQIVTPAVGDKSCSTGITTPGGDPAIAAPTSYAQPVASTAPQPLPTCSSSSSIVAFTPGYYDDAVGLSALTGGAAACQNKTFWFQPGVYYFDFHNSEMPASGSPVVPRGADVWTFNDATSVIVGGTKVGWTTSGVTAAALPGACLSPLKSTAATGVQFVFGDDSRFYQQAGSVELCGSYAAAKPPITVSAVSATIGSAAPPAVLRPSVISNPSVPDAAPDFVPLNAAALANESDASAGPAVTDLPPSSKATLRINEVTGQNSSVPARSVLDTATITVRHGELNAAVGTTMKLVYTARPGATPIVKSVPLSRTSTLTYSTQTIDILDELGPDVYAFGANTPFTLDVVLETSSAAQSVTAQVDFVRLNFGWRESAVRPQSGCVVVVGGCATIQSTSAGTLLNELYVQGTAYLPNAKVALAVRAAQGSLFADGIVARAFVLDSDAYAGTGVYDGVLLRLPTIGPGATPLQVYLTAWTCPSLTCTAPAPSGAGWKVAGRTLVKYTENDAAAGPVAGQRDVDIESWQIAR